MAVSLLRYANREADAQALTERGYHVSRATVNRWAKGAEMPAIAARMIAELFGHTDTQKSAPAWAEALADETAKKVIEALRLAEETDRGREDALIGRLESLLQPPAAESPAREPGSDQAAGRPPSQSA